MLDEKDDSGLTESEKSYLKSLKNEQERIDAGGLDTDGEIYSSMRISEKIRKITKYAKDRKILQDRNISFKEIPGGFIIQSPKIPNRKFYYYPHNSKWRQEGKSQYYRCKDTNDLLDRFILDTSFKGKKND